MNLTREKKSGGIFIVIILLILFQNPIASKFSIAKYIDEIVCLALLLMILIKYLVARKKMLKYDFYTILLLLFLFCIGLLSNFMYKIQTSTRPILLDVFSMMKFFAVYFAATLLSNKEKKDIVSRLQAFFKIYIVVCFFLGLINLITNIGMSYDVRYGIRSFQFIYNNPGELSNILIFIIALLNLNSEKRKGKTNNLFIGMALITILLTLRGKAFAMVGIYAALVIFLNNRNKITFWKIAILGVVGILLAYSQISFYFIENDTQRSLLLKRGFTTANTYFPFGSGFATYGSDMAQEYYSPLYYEYGFGKIHGLSPKRSQFLTDNFIPMLMGQFGYIGMMVYLLAFFLIFVKFNKINIPNKETKIAFYFIYASLAISMTAAAVINSNIGCLLAIGCGLAMTNKEQEPKKEE